MRKNRQMRIEAVRASSRWTMGVAALGVLSFFVPSFAQAACPEGNIGLDCSEVRTGSTAGQGNNSDGSCDGDGNCSNDVAFTFTAPVTGTYNMNTFGSSYDTVLYVRTSCGGGQLACNDDSGGLQSSVNVNLSAGQTVTIIVDGYSDNSFSFIGSTCSGSGGNYRLTVTGPGNCFVCGNGVLEGPEQCDPPGGACCNNSTCTFLSGNTCRASAGVCDPAETCPGNNANCPADAKSPNGTVCRGSAGVCDVVETCNGVSNGCPADGYQPNGTLCRGSAGVCDVVETCTGGSAACPADGFLSAANVCRPATDVCDSTENCTGGGPLCPADGVQPNGTTCRAATDLCDATETCNGVAKACPADGVLPGGTVCNPGSGDPNGSGFTCDPNEVCDGATKPCPADSFSSAATVCNVGSGDVCDPTEFCPGAADQPCPADTVSSAATVCNAGSGDVCDPDETCTGVADQACPPDNVAPGGTVCNPGSGNPNGGTVCDPDEVCSGTADVPCPADTIAPGGTVCNPGTGDLCDPDETCSGAADSPCPTDSFEPNTTVCNPGSGNPNGGSICDPDELCPGAPDVGCPVDTIVPAGTVCNFGSNDLCDVDEECNGVADVPCPVDVVAPAGTLCRGLAGVCDVEEFCTGNPDDTCPVDGFDSVTNCRPAVDNCDADEICPGTGPDCPADGIIPNCTACDCQRPAFFVNRQGKFNNNATIDGDIGANALNGKIKTGREVTMAAGTTISGNVVRIGRGSIVENLAGNNVLVHPEATVNGTIGPVSLPLEDPFCPIGPFSCGGPDIEVAEGATLALAPGSYDKLIVRNGGHLELDAGGTYNFCNVKVGRIASIFAPDVVRINVASRIKVAPESSITTGTGDPILLNVVGRTVRFSQDNIIQASIIAPNAKVKFQRRTTFTGCFCADANASDKTVALICPSSPSGAFLD